MLRSLFTWDSCLSSFERLGSLHEGDPVPPLVAADFGIKARDQTDTVPSFDAVARVELSLESETEFTAA